MIGRIPTALTPTGVAYDLIPIRDIVLVDV
jgi:hypothetical protein